MNIYNIYLLFETVYKRYILQMDQPLEEALEILWDDYIVAITKENKRTVPILTYAEAKQIMENLA